MQITNIEAGLDPAYSCFTVSHKVRFYIKFINFITFIKRIAILKSNQRHGNFVLQMELPLTPSFAPFKPLWESFHAKCLPQECLSPQFQSLNPKSFRRFPLLTASPISTITTTVKTGCATATKVSNKVLSICPPLVWFRTFSNLSNFFNFQE